MKPALATATALVLLLAASPARAQSPDEILSGAEELHARLEAARLAGDAEQTCAIVPVIEAERLAVRRLMVFRLDQTLDAIGDGVGSARLDEAGQRLGRYIGVTNLLSRLLGRAEMACENQLGGGED